MSDWGEVRQKTRQRSPAYPATSLLKAVEHARKVYQLEHSSPVPRDVLAGHLGFSPMSSGGKLAMASMRKYGLLDGQADELRLTELALSIVFPDPDNPDATREALRNAALLPSIYREIWEKYGGHIPTDESLRYFLERQRGFNPGAIKDFLRDFRETLAYAGLDGSLPEQFRVVTEPAGSVEAEHLRRPRRLAEGASAPFSAGFSPEAATEALPLSQVSAAASRNVNQLTLALPVVGGGSVEVRFPRPVTSREFQRILKMIELSEPAFVSDDVAVPASPSEDA